MAAETNRTTGRTVAIAIGVGNAERLPYLGGAINGATGFVAWARAMGHDAHAITDGTEEVTLDRLRSDLERTLAGAPIHRLLLYFAGHGLIREVEEGLWLLSDWYRTLRAVAVEPLKRRLYRYGIDQVAIFADACRSLPADITAADLTADAVLGRGPLPPKTPAVDKFIAAQDGATTFMIPGGTPEDDRCLFSGVLLEGLWGTKREAFSRLRTDWITSRSLAAYLATEVKRLSELYGKPVVPNLIPTFPEGDDIYYGDGATPAAPAFPMWPAAPTLGIEPHEVMRSANDAPLLARVRKQSRPSGFDTGTGFAVDGLVDAWSMSEIVLEQHGAPSWWRLRDPVRSWVNEPVPLLLELPGAVFAAMTCLPEFIATITVGRNHDVAAIVYREVHGHSDIAAQSERAIAAMEARIDDAAITLGLAVELRQGKHADPLRGVISAYLYDAIGDLDSIRRMAYYYIAHHQPIPYDIALLAQLDSVREPFKLIANVPAVPARTPRTTAEAAHDWAWSATPSAQGVVGGLWPWLRQGWAYLDESTDAGRDLVDPYLIGIRDHLRPARFTTLDAKGAELLRTHFRLVPKRGI